MTLSITQLLQALRLRGDTIARTAPVNPTPTTPLGIRLRPATRAYLAAQAEAFGIPLATLISTLLDGVVEASSDAPASAVRTVRERLLFLLDAHGLSYPAAAELLQPYGFTLSTFENPSRLAELLTTKAIEFVAHAFRVSKQWVAAASDDATSSDTEVRWYLNEHAGPRRLLEYRELGRDPRVLFVRRQGAQFDQCYRDGYELDPEEPIGVVIELTYKLDSGETFTYYEPWEFERWNYRKCRDDIKLLIAFVDQAAGRGLMNPPFGVELPSADIDSLLNGRTIFASIWKGRTARYSAWHPAEYASMRGGVRQEQEEWLSVADAYRKLNLDDIMNAAR